MSNHDTAVLWCRHAFPPTTTKALSILVDEHMANGLRYAAAQVSSYLVSAAERISDIETIQSQADKVSIECAELKAQVAKMEADNRNWEAQ